MKFAVTIISPPGYVHAAAFREVAETIDAGLRILGHDSLVTTQAMLPGRRHIVLGANLLPKSPQPLSPDAILYNLEQVRGNTAWFTPALLDLFRRHTVWDYATDNAAALAELGVSVGGILPIGYADVLTRISKAAEPDIDVLFFGSMNERRRNILEAMQARGLRVAALFAVYGQRRDALIGRSKLMLNAHFYAAKVLEMVRISYYLANRMAVLSEPSANPDDDNRLASGVAFGSIDELPDLAVELCADASRRQAIAERGFELMSARRIESDLEPLLARLAG